MSLKQLHIGKTFQFHTQPQSNLHVQAMSEKVAFSDLNIKHNKTWSNNAKN